MTSARRHRGFTLIELMLVVAIIGLLAAIALPKFANLVIKAKEAAIKGKLGALRSALSIYYADNEGMPLNSSINFWPVLTTGGRYLDDQISISIPTYVSHPVANGVWPGVSVNDWVLNGNYKSYFYNPNLGTLKLVVNCTHTDSGGITWSLW